MEGCEDVWLKCAVTEHLAAEKIPPLDINHCMQSVYGDKCVEVSTVRRRVWQFKQEEVGGASLCDKVKSGGQRLQQMRVKSWLNIGRSVLKLEEIMWKSDYAQL